MSSFKSVLSAVIDFLNDAQNLGLIKEYTLVQNDTNCEEISDTSTERIDLLISQFLKKLNDLSVPVKNSSSDDEYVFIEDEKRSESECTSNSPVNENSELLVNTDDASVDSYNSCLAEPMNEEAKLNVSHSPEKISPEKNKDDMKIIKEKDEIETSMKRNLVQINVDTAEMKRRISAFISRKRKEVDEWNVQEFCGRSYIDEQDPAWEQLDSCARVDAIFVPRRGCKSHIKVSRVQNVWGPQTHWQPEAKKIKQEPGEVENQPNDATLQAMDERLQILETHLKLKTDSTLRKNLFKRIKMLEDKILYIESTSPEYLHVLNRDLSPKKMRNLEEKINLNNVDEIQKRIEALKCKLKMKSVI